MTWRLLLTQPADGMQNMALDEALLERARMTGEGVVRVYSWTRPTISFGRNQRARGAYDPLRAARAQLDVVRRVTGGRALVHHREITYSVTARVRDGEDLRESYAQINTLLVDALSRMGVAVAVAGRTDRLSPPGTAPCFELPAKGELTYGGRKLVGSAQVRNEGAWLQHGSVLIRNDQHLLREAAVGDSVPLADAATLAEVLERDVTPDEFAAALFGAVRDRWDVNASEITVDGALTERAQALEARYADTEWTWRA